MSLVNAMKPHRHLQSCMQLALNIHGSYTSVPRRTGVHSKRQWAEMCD